MSDDCEKKDVSKNEDNPMQKLEEALLICKFGKFHVVLLFATFCAVLASVMVTTTSSYILPIAECDLHMTIMQKGILTAVPFIGQVGVSPVAGFITDAFGRKIFLVGGHIGMFVCGILQGSSQNYWVLISAKIMEGIFLSVAFAATSAMVSEITHKKARDRTLIMWAAFMPISLIVAALMSWGILPHNLDFVIWEGYFDLHSWNIYLYACSIWSLIAAVLYYFLPESPKFLLSQGREKEALDVLKRIYTTNTGLSGDSFPITSLLVPDTYKPESSNTLNKKIVQGLFEMKSLFRQPLLSRFFLFVLINFVSLFSYSPVRLWYPQISAIIENYAIKYGDSERFCVMIDDYTHGLHKNSSITINGTETGICVPHLSGFDTYVNGLIMGIVSLCCLAANGYFVKFVGQKPLIFLSLILCGSCSGALYWTNSLIQIAFLLSATCAFMQTAVSLTYNILVRVFPTSLRSISFSIVTMAGRIGSLSGSILFPVLLTYTCMAPFLVLFIVSICVAGIVYFLPNPDQENNGTGDR